MKHTQFLKSHQACDEGFKFASTHSSIKDAWNNCQRGDWMLWLAKKLDVDIKTLTLAKAYCAKTVYHLMKDERSKDAVVASINFAKGFMSYEELTIFRKHAAAAAAAAYAATAYAATAAAYAATAYAADAADAADAAAYAADAADAADAAAYAANAADAAAEKKNQLKTANICRKYLTQAVFDKLNQLNIE